MLNNRVPAAHSFHLQEKPFMETQVKNIFYIQSIRILFSTVNQFSKR